MCGVKKIMMLKTARIMASITINVASGLMPTTMGIGPMNTMAPKFAEPPESTAVIIKIVMPAKIMRKPMTNNNKNFWNSLPSLFAWSAIFCVLPS